MAREPYKETFFRTKTPVFTLRDELAFSRVLREFCPDTILLEDDLRTDYLLAPRVPDIPNSRTWRVRILMPSPGQESAWRENLVGDAVVTMPIAYFYFDRSTWEWPMPGKKWAFDPPLLGRGQLTGGFPAGNEELKKFTERVVRLVNKVTWKRSRLGLDACRWSQAGQAIGERRGLDGGRPFPADEEVTFNKYYDDDLWDDSLPEHAELRHRRT